MKDADMAFNNTIQQMSEAATSNELWSNDIWRYIRTNTLHLANIVSLPAQALKHFSKKKKKNQFLS